LIGFKFLLPVIRARNPCLRTRERLNEALGALSVTLNDDDLAAIERAVPKGAASGQRYAAEQLLSSMARSLPEPVRDGISVRGTAKFTSGRVTATSPQAAGS
jgi:hypothetical protein